MAKTSVYFFTEDISFKLKHKQKIRKWINGIVEAEGCRLRELNYIFCSDEYLLKINQQYLSHDTYTDIITFDNSERGGLIVGDIFISVDRVKENALMLNTDELDELHRVMAHGVLHLLGYADKGKAAKAQMTDKENQYLGLRKF